jgi:hypothetical protein
VRSSGNLCAQVPMDTVLNSAIVYLAMRLAMTGMNNVVKHSSTRWKTLVKLTFTTPFTIIDSCCDDGCSSLKLGGEMTKFIS